MIANKVIASYSHSIISRSTVDLRKAAVSHLIDAASLAAVGELSWIVDGASPAALKGDCTVSVGGETGHATVHIDSKILTDHKPANDEMCGRIVVGDKIVSLWQDKVNVCVNDAELWCSREYMCDK